MAQPRFATDLRSGQKFRTRNDGDVLITGVHMTQTGMMRVDVDTYPPTFYEFHPREYLSQPRRPGPYDQQRVNWIDHYIRTGQFPRPHEIYVGDILPPASFHAHEAAGEEWDPIPKIPADELPSDPEELEDFIRLTVHNMTAHPETMIVTSVRDIDKMSSATAAATYHVKTTTATGLRRRFTLPHGYPMVLPRVADSESEHDPTREAGYDVTNEYLHSGTYKNLTTGVTNQFLIHPSNRGRWRIGVQPYDPTATEPCRPPKTDAQWRTWELVKGKRHPKDPRGKTAPN